MPNLGAARRAHGEQHDLQVGGAVAIAPLGSARPTNHVLLPPKGCGAARGAHGEQHDLQVGGAVAIAPFASRGPPNTFYYL